jgi:hypothetical protein
MTDSVPSAAPPPVDDGAGGDGALPIPPAPSPREIMLLAALRELREAARRLIEIFEMERDCTRH